MLADLPFAEYQADPSANPSFAKAVLAQSPKHAKYFRDVGSHDTDAMRLGRLVHALCLEPDKVPDSFAVWDGRRAGKDWERFVAAAESEGRDVVRAHDSAMAYAIASTFRAEHAELVGNQVERVVRWESCGVECKGRPDSFCTERGLLLDLKTTADIEPGAWLRQATRLRYHLSLAAYREGLSAAGYEVREVWMVVVETKPPHDSFRVSVPETTLRAGLADWHRALRLIEHCQATGRWPGVEPCSLTFDLPEWAMDDDSSATAPIIFGGKEMF